jgi:hypothetical protein
VQRSELLRSQIDGGGLLQLVSLLALHVTLSALFGVVSGAAVGWATLVVPLIAGAAAFERSRRTGRTETLRDSTLSAVGACWAVGLVQTLLTIG